MRPTSLAFAFSAWLAVATAQAQEGGVIEPARPVRQDGPEGFRSILEQLNPVPPRDLSSVLVEGLARDAASERLTWERAYKLALVRSREPGRPPAATLDPKALDEAAARLGFADFARFRREFAVRDGATFRDPSARIFDLLGRSQAVVHARDRLAALENLLRLLQELVGGETSGLTQLQSDQVNQSIQRARLDLLDRQARYRDALDEAKVELGLAPSAPIFLDLAPVEGFASVFEQLTRWGGDPSRELSDLLAIISGLPALMDVEISGLSLMDSAMTQVPIEGTPASFIDAAGRRAASQRGAELEVRKRARKLLELAIAYRVEQKRLILIVRTKSQAVESILAPPQPQLRQQPAVNLISLLEAQDQLSGSEDRLVEVWAAYHAGRLALIRDLNLLTATDWGSFRGELLGGSSRSRRTAPVPPVIPGEVAPASPGRPFPPSPPR